MSSKHGVSKRNEIRMVAPTGYARRTVPPLSLRFELIAFAE